MWEELHTLCVTSTLDHRINISEVVGKVASGNICQAQRKQSVEKALLAVKCCTMIITNTLHLVSILGSGLPREALVRLYLIYPI